MYLDIKVSISGNVLCTSLHYKPTDSHSSLLYSSSHPSHGQELHVIVYMSILWVTIFLVCFLSSTSPLTVSSPLTVVELR